MSGSKQHAKERGVALIVALLVSSILFLMAFAINYTLSSYFKTLAVVKLKTQTYYTTTACVELLRDKLRNSNCKPPNWCNWLGNYDKTMIPFVAHPEISTYQDVTKDFTGVPTYVFPPDNVTLSPSDRVTQTYFSMFFRDDDDDTNYNSDQDKIVMALCKATSDDGSTTVVEASLLYSVEDQYKQRGLGMQKKGASSERIINDAFKVNQTIETTQK